MRILAFDIGGTQGRVALCENGSAERPDLGSVTVLRRASTEDGRAWFARLLDAARALASSAARPEHIGVSFGGPVDARGAIRSMHVPGWEQIDLPGKLSAAFGAPVTIENDANAGALGEHRFGAGRGLQNMAFFTVSTGIGGGVILNGRLFRGAHGLAGEFGHFPLLPLESGAPAYAAGRPGALESLASGPAFARRARELQPGAPETLAAKDVFDAAARGDTYARQALDEGLGHLARGIAVVQCAFDMECIIIGGGVSLAGEAFFAPLRAKLRAALPPFAVDLCRVEPAALADAAPLLGAIAAALEAAQA